VKYAAKSKSDFAKTSGRAKPGLDSVALFADLERLYGRSEFQAAADNDAPRLGRADG
jgi:hypothetical protein